MTSHAAVKSVSAERSRSVRQRIRQSKGRRKGSGKPMPGKQLASDRTYPCRLPPSERQFVERMMHQQLYVLGRDIVSPYGNLLIEYGCGRMPSPEPGVPSIYWHEFEASRQICFRGFGVFVGASAIGGVFIRRYEFAPRWMPWAEMVVPLWLPRDVPVGCAPRSSRDHWNASCLIGSMCQWFSRYEAWVHDQLGYRFRLGQLLSFRRFGNPVVEWDLSSAWRHVATWFTPVEDHSPHVLSV